MAVDRQTVVGVLGAGTMGSGIAQVAAAAGHRVILADVFAGAADKARIAHTKSIGREVEKGRLSADAAAALLGRIEYHTLAPGDFLPFGPAGLVIEAIVEDLEVKRATFRHLENVLTRDAVIGTNTSSLSVTAIAAGCDHPQRVIGIHFFNPAPVLPLVEIVPGVATDPAVTESTRALVDSWGKTTVLASDTPGFIVNRVARPFYGEALRIFEEGIADKATIDWAMRDAGHFKMGPFELMDLIGNDVNYAVSRSVFEAFGYDPRYRPFLTQKQLVDGGLLGRKTGRGHFDYRAGAINPEPTRDTDLAIAIFPRILAVLINAAIDALFWRVASRDDLDLAMTKGVNYPKGLLRWADNIGLDRVLERLDQLHAEYGEDRYRASPLLRRMVAEGRTFYE
ncbi:MAG: 3-hydroxybutyryl-CoA dehydrogenase [Gemmatimonadales bacterium]|nr:3-hydroxybutyryl-CoA dehydrogenase [Gemmatimonadales bacterium]